MAVWSRPVVWERRNRGRVVLHDLVPPQAHSVDEFCELSRRRSRPFPSQPGPLNTPAGLKPMIDLMQRARDRETYGGACD